MPTTDLIPHQTVTMIVENVDQARRDVLDAFKLLANAKERLGAVLGTKDYTSYNSVWRDRIYDSNLPKTAEEADTYIACNTWRYLLAQTGMLAYMTAARQKELHAQLDTGQFPSLTVENILSTMEGLRSDLGGLLIESVKEVFDWLRPARPVYKTNKPWRVGNKVVVDYLLEPNHSRQGFWIKHSREGNIRALGNVFSLLDGKGILAYPDDLWSRFVHAMQTAKPQDLCELPYMTCRAYLKGTVHFSFTRQDLVDRLNQLASDGSLGEEEHHKRAS